MITEIQKALAHKLVPMLTTSSPNKLKTLKVFIVATTNDEALRLASHLQGAPDIELIGHTTDARTFHEELKRQRMNVIISDVQLGSVDLIPYLADASKSNEELDILIYTSQTQESIVMRAISAGATGYLLKGDQEDLVTSLRLMQGGGSPVSPTVARSVLRAIHSVNMSNVLRPKKVTPDVVPLSQREGEILALLAKGISFAEIGSILSISPHTVTAHIKKIYRKLQVHSRGEAVYEAQCMGILPDRIN